VNILRNQFSISAIALILTLTVAAISVALPAANAHTPPANIETFAYLAVAPNPVGVGQTVTVVFWLSQLPPTANGQYGDRWENYFVDITLPDGSQETLGPFTSDPVGSAYTFYTPTQVGNYTFVFRFLGQTLAGNNPNPSPTGAPWNNSPFIGDYFEPSTSAEVILNVQQQQIPAFQDIPLPTQYWSRPIEGQNRLWYTISGNWLGSGFSSRGTNDYNSSSNFAPYRTAPNTAHIMWTKPLAFGGLIGGEAGGTGVSSYYTGSAYESMLRPPVIIQGRLYYNTANPPRYGFNCVDLRTGETIWYNNGTEVPQTSYSAGSWLYPGISCGQVLNYISPNQYGGIPYLWYIGSPNYYMYDAFTGNWILTFTNAQIGTLVMDPMGNMLMYVFNGRQNWLAMWNSTLCIQKSYNINQANADWLWRPKSGTFDWNNGIQWNTTIADVSGQSLLKIAGNTILARSSGVGTTGAPYVVDIGYSTTDGHQLWIQNRTSDGRQAYTLYSAIYSSAAAYGVAAGDGIYAAYDQDETQWYGYSLETGELLWGPTEKYTNAWDMYMSGRSYIAYGHLYAISTLGIHCFDDKTGELLWYFTPGPSGLETIYGNWPLESAGQLIVDGKIYVGIAHSHLQPLFRGAKLLCINATTGVEIWNVTGWYGYAGSSTDLFAADGYVIGHNLYDGQIYCFGKGPSATTVDAPMTDITLGQSVVIRGTVMDISAGTKQNEQAAVFPNGVPCVSDDSMSAWMEFVYTQEPCPAEAEGVEVVLTTLDPNGNTYEIGRTTTSLTGTYGIAFDSPVPGLYKIIATFEGSDSYYSSYAETYINVEEAPSAAQSMEPEATAPAPTQAAEAPLITTEIAILIAVAVAVVTGIVSYWSLRKRK
jgi:hypothetical protein